MHGLDYFLVWAFCEIITMGIRNRLAVQTLESAPTNCLRTFASGRHDMVQDVLLMFIDPW